MDQSLAYLDEACANSVSVKYYSVSRYLYMGMEVQDLLSEIQFINSTQFNSTHTLFNSNRSPLLIRKPLCELFQKLKPDR